MLLNKWLSSFAQYLSNQRTQKSTRQRRRQDRRLCGQFTTSAEQLEVRTLMAADPSVFLPGQSGLVGDFDGNGKNDVLFYGANTLRANGGVSASTLLSQGSGSWTVVAKDDLGGAGWLGGQPGLVGDFDGNGKDDVLFYGTDTLRAGGGLSVLVLLSQGNGTWTTVAKDNLGGAGWLGGQPGLVGDFDGNGKDDVLFYGTDTLRAGGGVSLLTLLSGLSSTGNGTWTAAARDNLGGAGWLGGQFGLVGDFDGNGKDDLLFYGADTLRAGGGVSVLTLLSGLTSAGYGTWTAAARDNLGGAGWLGGQPGLVGDFDGNGKDDVLFYGSDTLRAGGGVSLLTLLSGLSSTGNGTWTAAARDNLGGAGWLGGQFGLVGDFDGNGKDDLLFYGADTLRAGGGVSVLTLLSGLTSAGYGTWTAAARDNLGGAGWLGGQPGLVGDFDGNGKDDVLFYGSDTLRAGGGVSVLELLSQGYDTWIAVARDNLGGAGWMGVQVDPNMYSGGLPLVRLFNRTLIIGGTIRADTITVNLSGAVLTAAWSAGRSSFYSGQVSRIVVLAGAGDDRVDLSGGSLKTSGRIPSSVYGGTGNDVLIAGAGNDLLYGNGGDDYLDGGAGTDIIYGDSGDDFLIGGTERDVIYGGVGIDTVFGVAGDDVLDGTERLVYITDDRLRDLVLSKYTDLTLDRQDMLAIFSEVQKDGVVSPGELASLRSLAAGWNSLNQSEAVHYLLNQLVLRSGTSLGASTFAQLVDKVFRGKDLPAADPATHYVHMSGSLFGPSSLFGPPGPNYRDVQQGNISDCSIMATLAELAFKSPDTIRSMIVPNGDQTWTVHLYRQSGESVYVTVDDQLPVDAFGREFYASAHPVTGAILWPALIEKACAQVPNLTVHISPFDGGDSGPSYKNLDHGAWGSTTLTMFTGRASEFHGSVVNFFGLNPNEVRAAVQSRSSVIVTSFLGGLTSGGNVVAWHNYAVLEVNSATGMFHLFNPWGTRGANGEDGKYYLGDFWVAAGDLSAWGKFGVWSGNK